MDDPHIMYSQAAASSSYNSNGHCSHHPYTDVHPNCSPFSLNPHHNHHQHGNPELHWPPPFQQHHAFANCSVQSFTPDSLDGNNNSDNFHNSYSNALQGDDVRQHHCIKWSSSCASTPDKTPTTESFYEHAFPNSQSFPSSDEMEAFTRQQIHVYDCPNNIVPHHQIKREPDQDQCLDLLTEDYSSNSSSMGTITGSVPEFYTGKFSLSDHPFHSPTSPGVPEDDERRRKRRERNKVAATKCRHKKKEHVFRLNMESEKLESSNISLKVKLSSLEAERNHLIDLMNSHQPFCLRMGGSPSASSAAALMSMQQNQPSIISHENSQNPHYP